MRIELSEYEPVRLPREALDEKLGESLFRHYGQRVNVEFPSPRTEGQWQLTSQGWVGTIPLSQELHIVLKPKVPLGNLFRMLEYAYRLKGIEFISGLTDRASLTEFYERLANILARRVLDRSRRGFYRTYEPESGRLSVIRGRLDIPYLARRPWDAQLHCHYHEHTTDTEENQLLTWTLLCIARSGLCTERVLPVVRQAFHRLQGVTSLVPLKAKDCLGRLYNRLNEDYQPLHALCRFFLEHSGPHIETGEHKILPFLVSMHNLFQTFVTEWLRAHLPAELELEEKYPVPIAPGWTEMQADIVLRDAKTGTIKFILDTKYKYPEQPDSADFAQVHTYAALKGCQEAVLVYPAKLQRPLNVDARGIRVRSATFLLSGDLEEAGRLFLTELLERCQS